MRKILLIILLIVLLPAAVRAETRLMVVSDLHYLAPSLYRDSGVFLRALRGGDGKITQYGEELLSALYREIVSQRPDALAVTGDLTFNGEKESHIALASWFKAVEDAGVPVWIIPGNHDINVSSPVRFTADGYEPVEGVTPEDFAAIYADFLTPGTVGFSYAVPVGDGLLLAMTDVALYRDQAWTPGMFTAQHAAWLESALQKNEGATVVTATHHSLLPHTEFSKESFLMFGNEEMAAALRRHGVRLNLSGHLHIQHIARDGALNDAALGAFCIWPHRYAMVTLTDRSLTYEARSLSAAFLPPDLPETSKAWFEDITREKVKALGLTGTEDEVEAMADYAARFNLAYFSGLYDPADASWTRDPAYALWERQDCLFGQYMRLVMNEENGENLRITIPR